jgi:hypothetical protein
MLVNEYKPEFQFRKSSKDAKFRQCLNLWVPPCYEHAEPMRRTDLTASLNYVNGTILYYFTLDLSNTRRFYSSGGEAQLPHTQWVKLNM